MSGSLSNHIRNICVFDGSSPGKEKKFLESANHLGQVLAERKIHLVCYPTLAGEGVVAGLIKSACCQLVLRVLEHQAKKWARVTRNKTVKAVRPKADNIW
jgi:hypothetical protein